jgi:hypothetical protein
MTTAPLTYRSPETSRTHAASEHRPRGNATTNALAAILVALLVATTLWLTIGARGSAVPSAPSAQTSGETGVAESGGNPESLASTMGRDGERDAGVRTARSEAPGGPERGKEDVPEESGPVTVFRGRVVDARGRPIPDVEVGRLEIPDFGGLPISIRGLGDLLPKVGGTTTSGPDGAFELRQHGVKPGEFELYAEHPEHPRSVVRGEVGRAPTEVGGLELVLEAGATVTGVLHDVPEGIGFGGIQVRARVVEERGVGIGMESLLGVDLGAIDALKIVQYSAEAALTDARAEGRGIAFEFRGLRPGAEYEVVAFHVPGENVSPTLRSGIASVQAPASAIAIRWQEQTSIRARILDAATGQPLADVMPSFGRVGRLKMFGIDVPLVDLTSRPERTDDDGVVAIAIGPDPEGRPGKVRFDLEGYVPHTTEPLAIPEAGGLDLGVIRLERAPVLEVLVVGATSGEPVAGAKVTLAPSVVKEDGKGSGLNVSLSMKSSTPTTSEAADDVTVDPDGASIVEATTDADGIARLTWWFESQQADLTTAADGYAERQDLGITRPDGNRRIIELLRGGTVVLTLLDGEGLPLTESGVLQRVQGTGERKLLSEEPDAQGRIVLEDVGPGDYEFKLTDAGMRGVFASISGLPSDELGWVPCSVDEGGHHEVVLRELPTGKIVGTVSIGGAPLDRATVRLLQGPGTGTEKEAVAEAIVGSASGLLSMLGGDHAGQQCETTPDGGFELRDVPIGAHRLEVRHASCALPVVQPIEVVEGTVATTIEIPATTLTGRIVDQEGQPIAGARIAIAPLADDPERGESVETIAEATGVMRQVFGSLMGADERAETDGDGRFELRGLSPGVRLQVFVEHRWFQRTAELVDPLGVDERRSLELRLEPAGRVLVRCDRQGALTVKASYVGADAETAPQGERTGLLRNGSTLIESLRPGTWRVTVLGMDDQTYGSEDVEIVERQTARVTVGP